MVKRKGLLEHMMRTSSQGQLAPDRPKSGMRRSKTQLDSLTALRKKDQIIQSGAYERSPAAPPKGRGSIDTEIVTPTLFLLIFQSFIVGQRSVTKKKKSLFIRWPTVVIRLICQTWRICSGNDEQKKLISKSLPEQDKENVSLHYFYTHLSK